MPGATEFYNACLVRISSLVLHEGKNAILFL